MLYKFALYGSKSYLRGKPCINEPSFYKDNHFILGNDKLAHLKSTKWLQEKISPRNVKLRVSSLLGVFSAIKSGVGIGILPVHIGRLEKSLVELTTHDESLGLPVWIVSKKEIFETEKIMIFTNYFSEVLRKYFS